MQHERQIGHREKTDVEEQGISYNVTGTGTQHFNSLKTAFELSITVKTGLAGAGGFQNLTSLPHKMPQVSTARLVLASANLRKLLHSSEGTDSCRRASTMVSGGEKHVGVKKS